MPQYEYICHQCKYKNMILCSISDRDKLHLCRNCGGNNLKRLISKFKTVRSEEQIISSLTDPSKFSNLDQNDPTAFAKWAKNMAREMGENMDDEIDAAADEELNNEDL